MVYNNINFYLFFIFFDKNIFQNNTVISRPITASIIPQSNDVHSPDGSFSIAMQSKESNSGFFTYEFFIENISGGKKITFCNQWRGWRILDYSKCMVTRQ